MSESHASIPRPQPWRDGLNVAVQVAFLIAVAVLVYLAFGRPGLAAGDTGRTAVAGPRPPLPIPSEPVSIAGAMLKGSDTARVVVIEFADAQCPYCTQFAQKTLPSLDEKYIKPGLVSMAFMHLPLGIHPLAPEAASAMECAGAQGKFWEMHDRLFADRTKLARPFIFEHAKELALKAEPFEDCLDAGTPKVLADVALADRLGVTGTPAFLIGTVQPDRRVKVARRLVGAQPPAAFSAILDELLAAESKSAPKR